MAGSSTDRGCGSFWPLINDFVDGRIADTARADLEGHLAQCPECQRAAADLEQIRRVAQALPPRRPRADAWQRIAAELEQELPRPQAPRLTGWSTARITLAAAAVLVLAVASTVWFVRQPASPAAPPQGAGAATTPGADPASNPVHPTPADLVRTVDEELKAAEQHYDKAISSLEQIARSDEAVLDPALAATLQKNLGVIDGAIRESRAAIQAQPASQLAQDSLFEALRRKVALLEETITLINAMRKGDQAGTAKAIQGMNKT